MNVYLPGDRDQDFMPLLAATLRPGRALLQDVSSLPGFTRSFPEVNFSLRQSGERGV